MKIVDLENEPLNNEYLLYSMSPEGPLVIKAHCGSPSIWDLLDSYRSFLESKVLEFGSILFRGFELSGIGTFERFIDSVSEKVITDYGDLPEKKSTNKVYGSTPYPENMKILFHNESSHMSSWPVRQYFGCVTPSIEGGETPIVDCRKIYKLMDSDLRKRFETLGLIYYRNFIPGLDVSWQDFYKTNNKKNVEKTIVEADASYRWDNDGSLLTWRRASAVQTHPFTTEHVFFNQIMLHHPYFLKKEARDALLMLYGEDKLPRTVTFGDGSPIDDQILREIYELYEQEAVEFKWLKGDLLMCDNMLVAHGRNPFQGERKIIVGLANPVQIAN